MNIDEKNALPPIKMHLLADNDTNQNITAREKFQKLSNLLMDDKNMTAIVALIGVVTLGLLAEKTVSSYTYEAVGANA